MRLTIVLVFLLSLPLRADSPSEPWRRYFSPQRLDALGQRFGAEGRDRAEALGQFLDREVAAARPVPEQLQRVNDYFNGLTFVDDQTHWGQPDYWATPLEFVASGGGDCEDFAIAKYFTLRVLGVPADKLRLTYAKAVTLNQAHMVLTYLPSPNGMPLVLDNLNPDILPGSERPDLVPVYSFNGEGLWRARAFDQGVRLKSGDSGVERWQELVDRITIEGE
ncbi:transglutaminase-like cysteine peptidase [Ferrimonas balearica]|uniref:transglutaminase-like cysteine peptidase n=1 Tax=Ferrimonas balearica TaxID=44012 RepID=UPI002D7ECDB8|nr:transglutaminase-like cysteine peptidase [Ferrimonas balearica]MBY6095805.1 transglutaminase-like cysteine peptidase [Ferrimonas balearica]